MMQNDVSWGPRPHAVCCVFLAWLPLSWHWCVALVWH